MLLRQRSGTVLTILLLFTYNVHCVTNNDSSISDIHIPTDSEISERNYSNVLDYLNGNKSLPVNIHRSMIYDAGTSSDLDGKSDIQEFDVILDDLQVSEVFHWDLNLLKNITSLEDLLNVFDVYRISRQWSTTKEGLGERCMIAMETYLTALNESQLWALKMFDANGRYSSSFFWGNTYWLGSQTLCYRTEKSTPFPLGFNVIKLLIHLPYQLGNKAERVLVGLCLPYSCTTEDVSSLTEATLPQWAQLLKVRSPRHQYDIWSDPVFWILLCVSAFVLLMVIIGTAYDHFLEYIKPSAAVTSNGHQSNGLYRVDDSHFNTVAKRNGTVSRIMLSFSLKLNIETIWDPNVGADTIPTIHGLRFLSMLWVILGHTCIIAVEYSDNRSYRTVAEENALFQTVTKGAFAVDTFFFISGLLVTFLYFRTIARVDVNKLTKSTGATSNILQFVGILVYRYLRLTVPYMFVLGVVQVSMKWFQNTSVFEPPFNDQGNCEKYWWRNALYINNFFSANKMCMLWSWYLADDTQFYVLGAVILIIASRYFRLAAVLMVTFLLASWTGTAFVAYNNNHMPGVDDPLALFDSIYDKPWTRLGPYLIGMSVGWLLYRTDCKINMHKVVVALGWILCTLCSLSLVYGLNKVVLHPMVGAAYSSLCHTIWALNLAWIVVACSTGYGGYVNRILSLSIIHPFSRVTYCAYLVHPLIIHVVPLRIDSPFHLCAETVTLLFFGQTVAAYMLAFGVSLTFEAPVVSLLKIISPSKEKLQEDEDRDWRNFSQDIYRSRPESRNSGSRHEIRR